MTPHFRNIESFPVRQIPDDRLHRFLDGCEPRGVGRHQRGQPVYTFTTHPWRGVDEDQRLGDRVRLFADGD